MTAMSDYLEDALINHVLRNTAFTSPVTVYLALFTGDDVAALEANNPTLEVTGGSYARVACAFDDPAGGGATANTSDVTFPTATASWGTVTDVAVVDHLTNTTWGTNVNVLFHGQLTVDKLVGIGDTFKFSAGELDVTLA
mgnify:CR=1 FL=1